MLMLMYMFHITFALGLIALVMGLAMCKCCCKGQVCETHPMGATTTTVTSVNNCSKCHCRKWCGIIISILAIISLVCTICTGYKQMKAGLMDLDVDQMHQMKDNMKNNMEMRMDTERNRP
jgi:hypothetical protein